MASGGMEFGPRALGARSILGDARSPTMQKLLNLKVKYRESFRPFAPVVLIESVSDWFDLDRESPYMLLVADVAQPHRVAMTPEQQQLFGIDKLNVARSVYSRRHSRRLLSTGPDRASRDEFALSPAHQPFPGTDRVPRAGQYKLQRPRRTDRLYSRKMPSAASWEPRSNVSRSGIVSCARTSRSQRSSNATRIHSRPINQLSR